MLHSPLSSIWSGFGTSRQLSGPGGKTSGMPSLSSSSSHSSPSPSLSESTWELLITYGQLSLVSWWPSPSLQRKKETRWCETNVKSYSIAASIWQWCYLSWFVSQESPTRSLSMSDWRKNTKDTIQVHKWWQNSSYFMQNADKSNYFSLYLMLF